MTARAVAVFLVAVLCAAQAAAADLRFDGRMAQGGLVVGTAAAGAAVRFDGRRVRVSDDGRFLLGFGRDAASTARLQVTWPDGTGETRTLDVEDREFPVQRIDGLPSRQVTPKPEDLRRIRADGAAIVAVRKKDTAKPWFLSGFVWPVRGRISGVFGSQRILNGKPRSPHSGTDIAAPRGTPVAAMADGMVALVHPDMFYTGKTVMVDHGHGLSSVYAHMDAILVEDGQWVAAGQSIGRIGSSGRATGPHLHWGVSLFSVKLDPELLVPPMPAASSP